MSLRKLAVLASVIFACTLAMGLRAEEGDKPEQKHKHEHSDKKSEDKSANVTSSEKADADKKEQSSEEKHGGNVFTRFWIHTVGGTMGNGLKTGAGKIKNAF